MQPGMLVSSGMGIGMGGVGGMPAMMQGAMQGMGQPGEVISSWASLRLQLSGVSKQHADRNSCKGTRVPMATPAQTCLQMAYRCSPLRHSTHNRTDAWPAAQPIG